MDWEDKPLQPERLQKIEDLLKERGTVKVSELSALCGVSENTIRRDLMELEEGGVCFRTKGGAGLLKGGGSSLPFSQRIERNRGAKRLIARRAAEEVNSGETIIIDSGTTGMELALEMINKSHVTVITTSLDAAGILAGIPDLTLILPGGIVHETSRSLTGMPAEEFFSRIHADTLFLSVKAVSLEDGLTDHTIEEAAVKRRMIQRAERVIVLADHTKLAKTALSRIADSDAMDLIITDGEADPVFLDALRDRGIKVIIAEQQ